MIWLINLSGLGLIGLIIWWFWLYRPVSLVASQSGSGAKPITILVADGVYQPPRIRLSAGEPVILRFFRQDPSPCAEMVVFDSLNLTNELPLAQTTEIVLPALPAGNYPFTCQMQMYRGELLIVDEAGMANNNSFEFEI